MLSAQMNCSATILRVTRISSTQSTSLRTHSLQTHGQRPCISINYMQKVSSTCQQISSIPQLRPILGLTNDSTSQSRDLVRIHIKSKNRWTTKKISAMIHILHIKFTATPVRSQENLNRALPWTGQSEQPQIHLGTPRTKSLN